MIKSGKFADMIALAEGSVYNIKGLRYFWQQRDLLYTAVIIFFVIFVTAACSRDSHEEFPEKDLLHFFEQELALIRTFGEDKDAYVQYLAHQQQNYPAKQQRLNGIIVRINKKFDGIPEEKKAPYQRQWRDKFQPVINEMSHVMKKMIASETAGLDPQKMAKIQELTIRLKDKESKAKSIELKPLFFNEPKE